MAENNDLKVIVGLNIPKSVVEIEGDLKIIEKALAKSDEGKLKITAGLNVGKTIGIINKQLSELKIDGSRLKITPTLDIDFGKQLDDSISSSTNFTRIAQSLKKEMSLVKEAGKSVTDELAKQLRVISENFDKEPQKVEKAFAQIEKIYNEYSKISRKTTAERNQDVSNLSTFFKNDAEINKSFNHATTISKYWYDRVVNAYGDENEARNALREAFGKYQVLAENESRNFAVKFDEIFRDYTETDVQGNTITYANSQENTFKQYVEARKKAYSWSKEISKEEIQNEKERLASIKETIPSLLNLVKVNEQVAESEIQVANAQKETRNTTDNQLSFDSHNVVDNIGRTIELNEKRLQTEKEINKLIKERDALNSAISANQAKIDDSYVFDDTSELETAIQKDQAELKRIEQEIANKTSVNECIKEQIKELGDQLKEERQGIEDSTRQMKENMSNGFAGSDTNISSEYLSNDISQIKLLTDSAKDAEQSFKDLLVFMGDTKGKVTSKEFADATGQVNSFTVAVKSGTGAVENFRYVFNEEQEGFVLENITAANSGIQRLTESTQKYQATLRAQADTLKANADALKSQWEDSNGGKSVRNEEHVAKLTEKYNELISIIEKLRGADKNTATEIKGNIKAQETEIKSLISVYHNAEKVATSLRARDTETSIINTKNNIREFMSNLNASKVSFNAVENELQKLAQAMQALDEAKTGDKAAKLREVLNAFENLQTKFKAENTIAKNFDQISKSVEKVIADLDVMSRTQIFNTHSNNAGVVEFQGKIKSLSDTAKQVKADLNALGDTKAIPPELKARIEDVKKRFDELNGSNKTLQANLRQNDGWTRTERQIQTLTARIKEYMAVNTKAAKKYSSNFDGLLSGLSQAEINKDSEAVRRLSADFQILQHEIKAAGDQGKTLFERIKADVSKFTGWLSITTVVSTGVREIRKMIQEVIKLDNSLLELSKVSDLTADGIKKVTERAFELSKQVGKTGTDVIDATTNFKRAGFELEESINLAEKALVLTNVAEGIDDAGEAATALISIMKGYGDTSTDFAQKILDAVNEVSNTQAIDFDSLIDGSQRLAAVANQGGASFEQMLGILTGTNEVLQNIEKTSSGAITIFTRLQSVQLPDEEDVLPLAKLQETFNKNTNGMVNIIDQTTGELRNVYDILNDISEVWDTLDKNTQEGLAFAASGTRQKNVFLSMMENWDNVKKSVESATNSMGSATEENQKYLDSISGRLSIVESNFQSLSQTVVNSDLVKFLVSGAGGALGLLDNIISKFGTLQTLLPIIMGSLSAFRNVGRAKMSALKREYADCNVVVTRNELMIA